MKNLMAALLKAQAEFGAVKKDGKNPAFHSSYATLGSVQDAALPALIANGIVCYQDARTNIDEAGRLMVYVGTMLFHVESGEQINQELGMLPVKQDPQGIGSAITYGRRYGMMTALGLSPDDDDGNSASGTHTQPAQAQQQRPPAQQQQPQKVTQSQAVKAQTTNTTTEVWYTWQSPSEAIKWAMLNELYPTDQAAHAALRDVLAKVYPGRTSCKTNELPAVFEAFYKEQTDKVGV